MNKILRDVAEFLSGIKRELPEIFANPVHYNAPAVNSFDLKEFQLSLDFSRDGGSRAAKSPAVAVNAARKKAGDVICGRVRHWSGVMGVEYGSVRVKNQKSLWGSCSGKKNLNFNWRLALMPPEILDYVVIHELAHVAEMNHSGRFWTRVSLWCPDYRERREWLRKFSSEMMRETGWELCGGAAAGGMTIK